MTVRIMVRTTPKKEDREAFEAAYLKVAETVRAIPGHLRDELLRDAEDNSTYILLAEWESEEVFRTWENDPRHREMAAPLNPYWGDEVERRIFHVRARLVPDPNAGD
jgi:heme-degrading monooxygenase HmoA